MSDAAIGNHAAFIWSVADLLRGDYKQSEYGRVILPLVVLRRLDCVLEPTKATVLKRKGELEDRIQNLEPVLQAASGQQFFNTSPLDFRRLLDDPANIAENLHSYIGGFSLSAREVIDKFDFNTHIARLERANLLYLVVSRFAEIDLHPDKVSNLEMGYLYEELIRRFSELSNETAGEHFTPREVIRLMVNLLFIEDEDILTKPGIVKTMYDPACGTGGMLSVAEDHLRSLNPQARLEVFGQELNAETYAICRSDMMLKGQDASRIFWGNSFSEDGVPEGRFDYMLANPPFGVEWKKVEDVIRGEAETKGFTGRFGAGLPRINDGSFLFLQHMMSKMKPAAEGGSRLAIVFNGSPLFTGGAGSGESEIRRWIIENDWLEAVVALPDQLFYNTGISTYFWIVTNRKSPERRGKVELVDARNYFTKMRKSLGNKRHELSPQQIETITRLYGDFAEGEEVKIFLNEAFGYLRVTVERPLRLRWEVTEETIGTVESQKPVQKLDPAIRLELLAALAGHLGATAASGREMAKTLAANPACPVLPPPAEKAVYEALAVRNEQAPVVTDRERRPVPDPDLRDYESVPLKAVSTAFLPDTTDRLNTLEYTTAVGDFMREEVLPYVPDAWVDMDKTKVGYEIAVTRYFYQYKPPRPLADIDAEVKALQAEIEALQHLQQRWQAVMAAGVSGSITSAATTKASSIPWLQRIPVGWREAKLNLVARLGSGHTPSRQHPEWWENPTIPWITTGEVAQMRSDRIEYVTETREMISELGMANSSATLHPANTVVLCRTASAGYSAIMGRDMATSQDFATWTCGPLLRPRFLLLCLRVMRQDLMGRLAMGSTHQTIYMPDIESIKVPLPPVAEQEAIIAAVYAQLPTIDRSISILNRQVELLEERRQALIAVVVSGELEIPGIAE
jgi:type I restriction enzyme M protein